MNFEARLRLMVGEEIILRGMPARDLEAEIDAIIRSILDSLIEQHFTTER